MKRLLSLVFVFMMLSGTALANYTKVKTDAFTGLAGANDYETVRNGDLKNLAVLGLLVADEIESVKNSKFVFKLSEAFPMGVASSSYDNRLIYLFANARNGKHRLAYIDLNTGTLYMETKDYDIDWIMDDSDFATPKSDVSYAYDEKKLKEAIWSLVVNP